MKRLLQIVIAIGFAVILLELLILSSAHKMVSSDWRGIPIITGLAALLYLYLFERKKKK